MCYGWICRFSRYALILQMFVLLSTGASCSKEICEENPKNDCICTEQYLPVCGCNHKTYSNACKAECAGITSYVSGACEK